MTNKFKFENIDDFDRHIDLSIPNYQTLNSIFTHEGFEFIQGDCAEWLERHKKGIRLIFDNNVSVIVAMFFLQFLGLNKRKRVLKLIKYFIEKGAVFLVAEKVYLNDSRLQTLIHRMHIQNKRKGFTDKEILDKDEQLSISMFCQTEYNLEKELKDLGMVSKVWQSYNFMGYVIQNKEQKNECK